MGLIDTVKDWLLMSGDVQTRATLADELADLSGREHSRGLLPRFSGSRTTPYTPPSIREAMGVPAIQRCVTIISNTTGMLPIQGFRNGSLMPEPPRVIVRPNPFQTQRDFYRDWAYALATRGDAIHWIANTDDDGYPSALYLIPPQEVTVEQNPNDRLFPKVRWGTVEGTWWSPITRSGRFLHSTYLMEPGALRGVGPLQMSGAAVSVSVESQEWAANFFAGGNSSTIIKHAAELSPQRGRGRVQRGAAAQEPVGHRRLEHPQGHRPDHREGRHDPRQPPRRADARRPRAPERRGRADVRCPRCPRGVQRIRFVA